MTVYSLGIIGAEPYVKSVKKYSLHLRARRRTVAYYKNDTTPRWLDEKVVQRLGSRRSVPACGGRSQGFFCPHR